MSATIQKVSFGNLATAKPDKKTKTVYPIVPDDNGQLAEIAARIIADTEQFDAIKGRLEVDKAELKMRCTPFYFETNHNKREVPSSVSVQCKLDNSEAEVLLTFQNRYAKIDDEVGLEMVLGKSVATHFRQSFTVEIDGDKLPADKTQELVDKVTELFTEYGCVSALTAKSSLKPVEQFHAARHMELTPEQNIMLDMACPIVVQVKTKGRKK